MKTADLVRRGECEWEIPPADGMRVPGVIYATPELVAALDDQVLLQVKNVATLPGIEVASFAMPDAHWGYGFPIGGVAAFDPARGGVISAGGVGFDISCGVRLLLTNLSADDVRGHQARLADALFAAIPAGVGSTGSLRLDDAEMDAMLAGGARWAVERGHGRREDLERTEEAGCMAGARPDYVSPRARLRQRDELGTLGSGNHYLEVQRVATVLDPAAAAALGLIRDAAVVSIHCGSRGLGHQIGTEFMPRMAAEAAAHGIHLPDRELACVPIVSQLGQRYLGAMRAAVNCALANRQVLTELTRQTFAGVLPRAQLDLLYDVSHNTCKVEEHVVGGERKLLYVHRKGATRAFGRGHGDLPPALRPVGQPVLIGGSMGTASYVLVGAGVAGNEMAFGSACHGAGRALSRHQAMKRWRGREVVAALSDRGILVRSPSLRGVAEEAPDAYKDIDAVCEAAERAGLARRVARLSPLICIKG
jgi:tRNA-splicing ligase RtcB